MAIHKEEPHPPKKENNPAKSISKSAVKEEPQAELPDLVKTVCTVVDEETAFRVVDALELAARRRAGNLHVGSIVFDVPYGEFRKLKPATPENKQDEDSDGSIT